MEHSELLGLVLETCGRLGVRHFITGSIASGVYGEVRFTHDVDVVAELDASQVKDFVAAFDPGRFYLSEAAALDAVRRHTQFNIIDPGTGLKIDVIIPAPTAFNRGRFERISVRLSERAAPLPVASVEDVILMKLVYFEEGGSEKHIRDITSMLRIQGEGVDHAYIEHWSHDLGVNEAWKMILAGLK